MDKICINMEQTRGDTKMNLKNLVENHDRGYESRKKIKHLSQHNVAGHPVMCPVDGKWERRDFWEGDFSITDLQNLESLDGCPETINGRFSCIMCHSITSLVGGPEKVLGDYDCSMCTSLESLVGSPKYIKGTLHLTGCNRLKSLDGITPHICGNLDLGSSYSQSQFVTLKDIHKHIKKMDGNYSVIYAGKLASHVLGVLLIDGCKRLLFDNLDVCKIINKYLNEPFTPHRLYDCQDELIEAGFEEYAQL